MAHLAPLVFASLVVLTTGMFSFPSSYPGSGGSPSGSPSNSPSGSPSSSPSGSGPVYSGGSSSGGGYPSAGGYPIGGGYQNTGYNTYSNNRYPSPPSYYPPPPPPPPTEKPLTVLDKLWERINDVTSQNKFALEQFDALLARMSLIKNFVDELELVIFPGLHQTDVTQGNDLVNLNEHLDNLENALDLLANSTTALENFNTQNANNVETLNENVAHSKRVDVTQDGQIANLNVAVKDLKAKLFTVMGNEFELFTDLVERSAGKLDNTEAREATRLCEVGSVTLSADGSVAEYVFQTDFQEVPGILYSVSGLNGNLDARPDPAVSHGYGPPPTEPNSAGVLVVNYATTKSVKFQGYDLSFGDSQGITADVDFQACTFSAGIKLKGI